MKRIAVDALLMDEKAAGIGHYAYHVIEGLLKYNQEDQIDIYLSPAMKERFSDRGNVRFIAPASIRGNQSRLLYELFRFSSILNREKYDLVHFLDYLTPRTRLDMPYIVTVHDISFYRYPQYFKYWQGRFKRREFPRGICGAERIVTVSEFTKRDLLNYFPQLPSSKITPILLGVEKHGTLLEDGVAVLEKYKINRPYVLFVGTVEPRKNIITLIKAMTKLWDRGECSHDLVISGKYGWMYNNITEFISRSRHKDKIILTGYVPDEELPYLYKNASLFVYPSVYEGFGLPPVEAMAYGIPVICSDSASLPEAAGDAALYFRAYEIPKLASCIKKVLSNDQLRQQLILKGKRRVMNLTWDKTGKEIVDLYHKLR